MNSTDYILNFQEDSANDSQEQENFWNSQAVTLQLLDKREVDSFYESKVVEKVFLTLRSDKRYGRYNQSDIDSLYEGVRRYIHLMGTSFNPETTLFRIDDMAERSIEIKYQHRRDVSVNLFVKDNSTNDSDYEETFISYIEDGQSMLVNNTLEGTVSLIKRLLNI